MQYICIMVLINAKSSSNYVSAEIHKNFCVCSNNPTPCTPVVGEYPFTDKVFFYDMLPIGPTFIFSLTERKSLMI